MEDKSLKSEAKSLKSRGGQGGAGLIYFDFRLQTLDFRRPSCAAKGCHV